MKKNIYFIICLFALCGLIFSLTAVNAIDSSSWHTQKVGGVDFKIPPNYEGGDLTRSGSVYSVYNLNQFQISSVDDCLKNTYGFDASKGHCEDMVISNHEGVHVTYYSAYCKDNLSKFYFSIGDSIFELRWKGSAVSPEIEEIVSNCQDSTLSSTEFHNLLSNAKNDYLNGKYSHNTYDSYDSYELDTDYENYYDY